MIALIALAWLKDPLVAQFGFVNAALLRSEYERYCNGARRKYPLNYTLNLELWLRQVFDER